MHARGGAPPAIYWTERKKRCPALFALDAEMVASLSREHPNLWIEDKLCEVARRRAVALAFASGIVKHLPKGRLKLSNILSPEALAYRTLEDMQLLSRVGTRVAFTKLTDLEREALRSQS